MEIFSTNANAFMFGVPALLTMRSRGCDDARWSDDHLDATTSSIRTSSTPVRRHLFITQLAARTAANGEKYASLARVVSPRRSP